MFVDQINEYIESPKSDLEKVSLKVQGIARGNQGNLKQVKVVLKIS